MSRNPSPSIQNTNPHVVPGSHGPLYPLSVDISVAYQVLVHLQHLVGVAAPLRFEQLHNQCMQVGVSYLGDPGNWDP